MWRKFVADSCHILNWKCDRCFIQTIAFYRSISIIFFPLWFIAFINIQSRHAIILLLLLFWHVHTWFLNNLFRYCFKSTASQTVPSQCGAMSSEKTPDIRNKNKRAKFNANKRAKITATTTTKKRAIFTDANSFLSPHEARFFHQPFFFLLQTKWKGRAKNFYCRNS